MGNAPSFKGTYSRPILGTDSEHDSHIYRSVEHFDKIQQDHPTYVNVRNQWEVLEKTVQRYPDMNCVGQREQLGPSSFGSYTWIPYKRMHEIAMRLGTKLIRDEYAAWEEFPEAQYAFARKMRSIGIYTQNCPEWFQVEQAANAYNIVLIPLYDSLNDDTIRFIINETKIRSMVVSKETLHVVCSVADSCPRFKRLIYLDTLTDEARQAATSANLSIVHFGDLLVHDLVLPTTPAESRDAVWTIAYTSGTCGNPKGVVLTHGNVLSCMASVCGQLDPEKNDLIGIGVNDVHISYLPLAHLFERLVCCVVFAVGGSIGCYSGDVAKLMDDIRVLEPTVFVSVPRLFNRINDRVSTSVLDRSTLAQTLFNRGIQSKIEFLRSTATATSTLWDSLVFSKTRHLLGTRLRFMVSGGAPLDPVVHERMQVFFCAPLIQGYGMTETCGPCFLCSPHDPVYGQVGGVFGCVEFRLRSVHEMNYLVTDQPPRGELLLRGASISKGYFLDSDENNATWDGGVPGEDGWLHTGDIVMLLPSNGITVVDRKKNIFKLSQGEYVTPEIIENVYGNALSVAQVFVYGDSAHYSIIAIVVPDVKMAQKWARDNAVTANFSELCTHRDFIQHVMDEMHACAAQARLRPFEQVTRIHLSTVPFSVENGTMTPTQKLKRHQAKKMYEKEIEATYRQIVT